MKKFGLFQIVNVIVISMISIIIVYPIWNVVILSFNDAQDALKGGIYLWPREFTLANYKAVFQNDQIPKAFSISVSKTLLGAFTHTLFTAIVAYGMSKKDLRFRGLYMKLGIVAMYFGGGMIPYFLLIKGLGLYNNYWVYIIPALFAFYDMILIMNFYKSIPVSLEESAMMDGARPIRIFFSIMLPLSMPVLAAVALFNGVDQWNEYMTTRLFIRDQNLYPLQMVLYQIIAKADTANMVNTPGVVVTRTSTRAVQLATMVIATAPILAIYPFLQRYFISGIMIGAVKE